MVVQIARINSMRAEPTSSISMRTIMKVLCGLGVLHALAVVLIWVSQFAFDIALIGARAWLILAWGWLIWVFILVPLRKHAPRLVLSTLLLTAVLLTPCVTTVYTFTAWSVEGFAP